MIKSAAAAALALLLALPAAEAFASERTDIRVVAPWEVSGPDPATDGYIFLRMGVMETLADTDAAGALVPGLAATWEASEDGLTWRFKLREANFHDGTPLTADAAAAALNRALSNPGPLGRAPVESIAADGDAVVVTLKSPFAALPALLAHSSTGILAPSSFDADGNAIAAIGTGPFKVDKITAPQAVETARFDGYWGEPAKLERASYLAAKRAETRALMAESGDADLVFTLDPSGYARLGQVDKVKTVAVAIPRTMLVKVNAGHPMLDSPEARQALSLAIDREGIAAGILRFPDAGATQLFPPALSDWHDPQMDPLGYDPEKAAALLAGLGWVPGDDGILTRDGERFALTLTTFPDRPEQPLVAAALQDQFKALGIDLTVNVTNYSEIPAGHQDGSLELAILARNYGLTPDPIGTIQGDFGPGGGDWGAMNWDAPAVADAVAKIAASADPTLRKPLISKVVHAAQAELPLLPLIWYQHTVAIADGLEDVAVDPFERDYGLASAHWAE